MLRYFLPLKQLNVLILLVNSVYVIKTGYFANFLNSINLCLGLTRISIHTDSDFVIKSVNEWMPRWQAKGWKTSAGAEVKNKEMFMILNKKIQSMDSVSWVI